MEARLKVGKGLKKLRIDKDQTITELSKKTGINVSTISGYETAKRNISLDKLVSLLESLDTEIVYFFEKYVA